MFHGFYYQTAVSYPSREIILPEATLWVRETAFTLLMTYIVLDIAGDPDSCPSIRQKMAKGNTVRRAGCSFPIP